MVLRQIMVQPTHYFKIRMQRHIAQAFSFGSSQATGVTVFHIF